MQYRDFVLEATGALLSDGASRRGKYQIHVIDSPAGETEQAVPVDYDDKGLQYMLDQLEQRELDTDRLIKLGRTLAAILLPPQVADGQAGVRELLARSLIKIPSDQGLRLRLRLPYELSVIPWEYLFVEAAGGEGMDGFLALNPRTAIVRHEKLAVPADVPLLTGDIKVVTALSEVPGMPPLDLDREQRVIDEGLKGLDLVVEQCPHATWNNLQPMLNGAGVFHFAGHGDFAKQIGPRPGTYKGKGFLAFEDGTVDAQDIAINLQQRGIRLAVLAACQTGHRDGFSVWSGIAPALVKAQIPAVVAHQYKIKDTTAIAFTQQFYRALAAGLPIERAMTEGRIAAYNKDKTGRDWGVPVLYMRAGDGRLFQGPANDAVREQAQKDAEANIRLRLKEVKAGAVVQGAELAKMLGGQLGVNVTVAGTVLGDVVVARVDEMTGGKLNVDADVDTVGPGGKLTGVVLGNYGGSGGAPPPRTRGTTRAKPRPRAPVEVDDEPRSTSSVHVGGNNQGQVVGTQINYNYVQGTAERPRTNLIEETIRLDVAVPQAATVNDAFTVLIAVRQPEAPPLSDRDLPQVVSATGSIFREAEDSVVSYRIELTGSGFLVEPKQYKLRLRPRENSVPVAFQVTSSKTGLRTLIVTAYQEDDSVAAQTRLDIEIKLAVGGIS